MTESRLTFLAVACVAISTVASSAHAATSASASLSNVRIQLIDLDLLDGISPSITFTGAFGGGSWQSFVQSTAKPDPLGLQSYSFVTANAGEAIVEQYVGTPSTWGSGEIFAFDIYAGTGLAGIARAGSTAGPYSHGSAAAYLLNTQFVLSPQTQLIITALATPTLSVQADAGEDASAGAFLNLGVDGGPSNSSEFNSVLSRDGNAYSNGTPSLEASFVNASNVSTTGRTWLGVSASAGGAPLPAVPEPSSWGMLLLGLLGFAVKTRAKPRQ